MKNESANESAKDESKDDVISVPDSFLGDFFKMFDENEKAINASHFKHNEIDDVARCDASKPSEIIDLVNDADSDITDYFQYLGTVYDPDLEIDSIFDGRTEEFFDNYPNITPELSKWLKKDKF